MFTFRQSDRAIVLRTMEGRPQAFETLVFRYQKKAHAIARAFGLESAAINDVVQEAFLQAFRDLPALRDPSSFGGWFLEIVRHAALKEIRRAARGGAVEAGRPDPLHAWASRSDHPPPMRSSRRICREYLWRKVAELPQERARPSSSITTRATPCRRRAGSRDLRVGSKEEAPDGQGGAAREAVARPGRCLSETMPSPGEWRKSGPAPEPARRR